MEAEETVILERAEVEAVLSSEDEVFRNLDRLAVVLAHFAESVNGVHAQARLIGMEHEARRALFLYAGLSGALAAYNRDRKPKQGA